MNAGVLLDMGIMTPANGQTVTMRKKVQSDQMEQILTFMREERAYVNVMTEAHSKGAVRGQLVVPKCLDGGLLPTKNTTEHYGFANIMVSPDSDDKSVAVLIQVSFLTLLAHIGEGELCVAPFPAVCVFRTL